MPEYNHVNRVELTDGTVVMDITGTTAQAEDVAEGKVFFTSSGDLTIGTGSTIDDNAGAGDTNKTWSADKLVTEFGNKVDAKQGRENIGKIMTVNDEGRVEARPIDSSLFIDDTAGDGTTDKSWSADKLTDSLGTKLDKNQGSDNAGKFMKVGPTGELTPDTMPDPTGKADKVTGAVRGNFAGLDANGNLTDSGKKPSDFLTEHQDISGKVDKVAGKQLSTEDYTTAEKNKLAGIAEGATANQGTITGITMNGTSRGTTGVVDLGTVITEHQDISGKADRVSGARVGNLAAIDANGNMTDSGHSTSDFLTEHQDISGKLDASQKGAIGGVAELDGSGKVPASQLPSYVDDVVEYPSYGSLPLTGEDGKIYVVTDENKTYRWSGSTYIPIGGGDLTLGETSSTAYRGDRGKAAYDHAMAKGNAHASGLYKIETNSEGHVTGAIAVEKGDITALGIPGSDTTYESKAASPGGNDVSLVTTGEKATWNAKADEADIPTKVSELTNDAGYLTQHQDISGKLNKNQGSTNAGKFMKVDSTGELVPDSVPDPTGKADKVSNATSGNFAGLDANGNLTDSGKKPSDFLTEHQDISGKANKADAIKSITRSETTFTATRADGTTFTFDQQDTNTWRGIQDNLTSTSTTESLSAAQGKVLNDGKAAKSSALSLTATAVNWSSSGTITLTATGVTASNNIVVGIGPGATAEQYAAAADAQIMCTAQATNSITLKAFGTVPTVNIPISVIIIG